MIRPRSKTPARLPARARGFTLLEVMIALAILAVGSICVLSAFGAAIALHIRREADVRVARALEEARLEAQDLFDRWLPSPREPVPPPLVDRSTARVPGVSYSVEFSLLPGVAATEAVRAKVVLQQEGGRDRTQNLLLGRSRLPAIELRTSRTVDEEKADEKKGGGDEKPR